MTESRQSFWNPARRATYLERTAEKAAASKRRKDGEATAEMLDRILPNLEGPALEVLQALVTAGHPSFVAPHDHPLLRPLIAKGLLAYPRGQGGQWMRASKTSYTVPPAVWEKLCAGLLRGGEIVPARNSEERHRARALLQNIAAGAG